MKTAHIPYIIIIILLAILWFKGCNDPKDDDGIIITIPEQSGEFKPQEPIYVDRTDTVYITKWKEVKVYTQNPVNDSLAVAYQRAQDSLERYKMYLDAVSLRNFVNEFEDDFVKITSFGEVQGKLNYIGNRYTIKERVDNVPAPPETFLRLLAGAEIGNNLTLSDFRYKVGLGLQNSKGSVYRVGYGKESLQDYIYLGYDLQVFDWKR